MLSSSVQKNIVYSSIIAFVLIRMNVAKIFGMSKSVTVPILTAILAQAALDKTSAGFSMDKSQMNEYIVSAVVAMIVASMI